jgi:hypothetical protein
MDWWTESRVPWSTGSTKFIKRWPLNSGSRVQILWNEELFYDLISIVEWTVGSGPSSTWWHGEEQSRRLPWPVPWESSSSSYGGRKRARFLPTLPMRWGATVLLTLRWWRSAVAVGDGGLSSLSLGDGDRLLLWFSDDEESTYGGMGPRWSFLSGRLGLGWGVLACWRQ